jgi:Leucine-rich repeat (LRR) protein
VINLPHLELFHINFNQLSEIPEEIGLMKNLKDLAINYNHKLKDLPKVFWVGLESLKLLSLTDTEFYNSSENKEKINMLRERMKIY